MRATSSRRSFEPRPRIDDAAARVEDRALGRLHHLDGRADAAEIGVELRLIAPLGARERRRRVGAGRELDVFRDVDDDRPRPTRRRDMEGFMQDFGEVLDAFDQPVVLGAGARDAHRVAFLEGVRADQRRRDLARDADERDGIHQRVLQGRHRIGRAGTGCDQHDARLAGGAGIALGRVAGALLVADQDVLDLGLLEQRVVDGKDGAAGIAEEMLDAVVLHRLDHHLGPGHLADGRLDRHLVHGSACSCCVPACRASALRFSGIRAIKKALRGALGCAHVAGAGRSSDRLACAPGYKNERDVRHGAGP